MITKFFLSTILGLTLSAGLIHEGAYTPATDQNHSGSDVVKALEVDGAIHPHIELPTVEIIGDYNKVKLTEAVVYNGEVIPVIRLEEVVITATGMKTI